MNSSGDAAEQIVRMSLEGMEVAAKITGSAAKNIAALLYTILKNKDNHKTKGRQRLTNMLKSGKALKVFTIKEDNLKRFATEAKRYGVVYCALRGKSKSKDGMVDIMVRVEDAYKINRIAERFKFAAVDMATIKNDIEKTRESESNENPAPEKSIPDKGDEDKLLEELMGKPPKEESIPQNPNVAKTTKSHPSAPISEKPEKTAEGAADFMKSSRPSVRDELRTIKATQQQATAAPKQEDKSITDKPKSPKTAQHKQPPITKKKVKKAKVK